VTAEVPFLDLRAAYEELAPELDAAYRDVMSSGRYLFGEQLEGFEREFAAYSGASACVGLRTGFDALTLGLRALGVGAGDEVIVPTNTTAITWTAIASLGAVPVGVEPVEATHTVDPERLEAARTPRTRAVVPVHLYGRPADMPGVLEWARAADVRVLADAAQAHGARLGGEPVGALGDAAAWSLYPSKNLGAFADGGCVTSDSADLITRIRRLGNYGYASRDEAVEVGINSRLDELQAAFLRVRLAHLDEWNGRRRATANRYLEALSDLPLTLPPADDEIESSWHQFVIRVANRDRVRTTLAEHGIETLVHYPTPPFAQPAFSHLAIPPGTFPVAERLANEVLSLPIGPHLSPDQAQRVTDSLHSVLGADST
jgi:dTDP-3-amino-3,4,6-trideoxy-alpha-D-glucose transaminase